MKTYMKHNITLILVPLMLLLSGCHQNIQWSTLQYITQPSTREFFLGTNNYLSSTAAILTTTAITTPTPSKTATVFLLSTQKPELTETANWDFIREYDICTSPCFFGIIPGKSNFNEAKNILVRLGFSLFYDTHNPNPYLYGFELDQENFSISGEIKRRDNLVSYIHFNISFHECMRLNIMCDRSIYSPAYFIEKFGKPTKVNFYINAIHDVEVIDETTATPEYPPNFAWYDMFMYFEPIRLIVQYSNAGFTAQPGLNICPLTDYFDSIWVWLGEDPLNLSDKGVPIEQVTPLSIEEFSTLLLNDNPACFPLDYKKVVNNQYP
jgi:hypothetical protein